MYIYIYIYIYTRFICPQPKAAEELLPLWSEKANRETRMHNDYTKYMYIYIYTYIHTDMYIYIYIYVDVYNDYTMTVL